MARRTAAEIYQDLKRAGWDPAGATIMTAIALAETGGDTTAYAAGPTGRAYGAYLIRTDPAATGRGGARDVTALTTPAAQAQAAYEVSARGTDFSGWSAFRDGSYQTYLGQAQAAAAGMPTQQQLLGGARNLVVEVAVVGLGLALVGVGLYRAVGARLKAGLERKATQAAKVIL